MLVFKAAQVIASQPYQAKPYEFVDDTGKSRKGTSMFAEVTCLGSAGQVAVIRLKGKSEAEVVAKVGKLTLGKPAEIPVLGMEDSARGVLVLNG